MGSGRGGFMLTKLRFARRWIDLLMLCVITTRYKYALKHGDSLLPYLFIICAERLFSLFPQVEASSVIHGIAVCREAPRSNLCKEFKGKNKRSIFSFIRERLQKWLDNWKSKFLSKAGHEIIIKMIPQAWPTYIMNVFFLPLGLCNELEIMINSHWWGSKGANRKIH
ncbi:RNA-directed DNA polymerase [Gossypium australe]|uniref:RNA-directed DNA polymerase n=1 Tax=Gossypium australe TaxID=47621 RepID=A0A5B6UX38_9ROSI|nr:RNA-directed DNA polymerase [Gossypium australe]